MVDERAIALDNITSRNKKYKKLSDGTVIGIDILNDLAKYAELNLKRSYKIDISKWIVHEKVINNESTRELTNQIIKSLLQGKYKDNQRIIKEKRKEKKPITDDLVNFVILDDTSLIEKYKKNITFNSVIAIKDLNEVDVYLTPSIYDNDDPKEIAVVDNDLMILNKIFKDKHSKSIDDMVLNSFYKEINDKLDNIKNIILEQSNPADNDIKKFIKEDIYKKLFALYDVKKYNILNSTTSDNTKAAIDDRSDKLSNINNYVKGGAYDNIIIEIFKEDLVLMNKLIEEEIPEVKKESLKKDIEAIKEVINEISSEVKHLISTENVTKSSELYKKMYNMKKENIDKLFVAYEKYKNKIINNIDHNIDLKKNLHSSETFYKSVSDLDELKNDTSRDKYALLFNYIESLKERRKTGGALEKEKEKEKDENKVKQKNNENIGYIMHDTKQRLKIYKDLQIIYVDLVTNYYKIIGEPGEEEVHTNFLYDDLELYDEKTTIQNNLLKYLKKYNNKLYQYIEDYNKTNNNSDNISFKQSSLLSNSIDAYFKNIVEILKKKQSDNTENNIILLMVEIATYIISVINAITVPKNNKKVIKDNSTIDEFSNIIAEYNLDNLFAELKSEIDKNAQKIKPKDETENSIKNETNIASKKNNITNRITTLEEAEKKIKKSLKELYNNIIKIRSSSLPEYEDYVITLLKLHRLSFFENDDQGSNNHPILKNIKNEIENLKQHKTKTEEELRIIEKERQKVQKSVLYSPYPPPNPPYQMQQVNLDSKNKKTEGGGSVASNNNEYIYNESRQNDLDVFKENHKAFYELISRDQNSNDLIQKYNFGNFMYRLKTDNKYIETQEELSNKYTNKINSEIPSDKLNTDYVENIYETIWKDYNENLGIGVGTKSNIALSNINSNEDLYNRVIVNNLDPELVLKINFQDKAIFLLLVFIIRTISVVILEFLIEHNIIKTLRGSIVFYGFTYLFILFLMVFLVNYDSYKLRILLNYLNIHINASNLILQNILFIIFITLIFILVKSDDILKYFGTIFDYTNIYGSLYDYRSSFDEESDTNLSHSEKLKLLYRTDILSMIIFIFTGFLVLIL